MTIVFAIDPGYEAGMVRWNTEVGSGIDAFTFMEKSAWEIVDAIESEMRNASPVRSFVIVCERFTQQSMKITRQYEALEMIGALRWIARRHLSGFVLQSRADKSRVDDCTLKEFGFWQPSKPHMMDAARHMFVFIAGYFSQHDIMRRVAGTIKI